MFQCGHPSTPDEVTLHDCQTCLYKPRVTVSDPKKVILVNHLSPGDVAVMSAAVYSLHRQHPGKYLTAVDTTANELFEHNPDISPLEQARTEGWEVVPTNYDLVNQCNQIGCHMMEGYCRCFSNLWGINCPLLTNRPMIYLSAEEKGWMNQVHQLTGKDQKFFLLNAGKKSCYTNKWYGTAGFQKVVDLLRGKVLFVQVGAADHCHPPLRNVVNLVGKTDLRQLIRLVYHCQGCLTGVSLLHHLSAAFEKPCVTLLGGREPVPWNAYPKCQLLHVIGALPCCKDGGCWRSRTVKVGDNDSKDESLCEFPMPSGDDYVPKCLMMISPEEIAEKVLLFAGHAV